MKPFRFLCILVISLAAQFGHSQGVDLPKYSMNNLDYVGAFRLPDDNFGDARVAWSAGQIAINESDQTFFFSGSNKRSVAQFKLPQNISRADSVKNLTIIEPPIQNFSNILGRAPTGNPNDVNRITGLSLINGKLVVNAAVYYDASASNEDTTLIIEDPSNLANSEIRGYMRLQGGNHSAGWISKVPADYIDLFGHELVAGYASNLPINGRSSMGPSAFLLKDSNLLSATSGQFIPTSRLLDFGINNLLHFDVNNKTLSNNLWTELSYAYYGFIVPGTSTYLTIGQSGGHESGIGYKITQPDGYNCGGFCAYDHRDYYNYVWLWDVNDLISSFQNKLEPNEIRPHEFGEIQIPFQDPLNRGYASARIIGADFTSDGRLFIVLENADTLQSQYEKQPIVVVYQMFPNRPQPPTSLSVE